MQLKQPRAGTPAVCASQAQLQQAATKLEAGTGPIAIDAERAGTYRYDHRAFLIQIRRHGSGTHLFDPVGINTFAPLQQAIGSHEWILHSASQDLPCLAELGLTPGSLFDTEIAAKLLGRERVGLAALVEEQFGQVLAKGYGAADWSKRPLPTAWLNYAALDVELLIELREQLGAELASLNRGRWAEQEFQAILNTSPKSADDEPWRRTKRISQAKTSRQLGVVRELWLARDSLARSKDIAAIRIFRDEALMSVITQPPQSRRDLRRMPGFDRGRALSGLNRWWQAIELGRSLPESELPQVKKGKGSLPRPSLWSDKNPEAASRLTMARELLAAKSADTKIPIENLVSPAVVREICWAPPSETDQLSMAQLLQTKGVRPWQVELATPILQRALAAT